MKQHKRLSAFQIIRRIERMEKHYNKLRKIRKQVKKENGRKKIYNNR